MKEKYENPKIISKNLILYLKSDIELLENTSTDWKRTTFKTKENIKRVQEIDKILLDNYDSLSANEIINLI